LDFKKEFVTPLVFSRPTPEWAFNQRRDFMKASVASTLAILFSRFSFADGDFSFKKNPDFNKVPTGRLLTDEKYATGYNNFYEFSLDKKEVADKVKPWTIGDWSVETLGLIKKPKKWKVDELIKKFPQEERIYRLRCVEAWTMVLPWIGFPLSLWLKEMGVDSSAKYVKFTSAADRKQMPNVTSLPDYPWPYTEGLTIEEAMHPLTLIAVGLYGKKLPKQNGAPIRLVVPWKYGFKSIKSIAKIELVKEQPKTLWNALAPTEYGFYANVNPEVDHPRWSQGSERVIDGSFIPKRIPTLKFNGYEKEVASLYKGLDLKTNY
jgi:methionine sulfoxide reductase catalytic subunit